MMMHARKICTTFALIFVMVLILSATVLASPDPVAEIGDESYASLTEAITAVEDGETIVLQSAIENEEIYINKGNDLSFTIDLNGFYISENGVDIPTIFLWSGDLTLRNGEIENEGVPVADHNQGIRAFGGATLTFDHVSVYSENGRAVELFGAEMHVIYGTFMGYDDAVYLASWGNDAAVLYITKGSFGLYAGSDEEYQDGCISISDGCNVILDDMVASYPVDWQTVVAETIIFIPFFKDVPDNAWYRYPVFLLTAEGIINGRSATVFAPNENITRAEFIKILSVLTNDDLSVYDGVTSFSDVEQDKWYAVYVDWAEVNGITNGAGAGKFLPGKSISRQEVVTMLDRFFTVVYEPDECTLLLPNEMIDFTDASQIQSWAKDAVETMVKAGVIDGYEDGSFRPSNSTIRAEAAKMVQGFLESIEK